MPKKKLRKSRKSRKSRKCTKVVRFPIFCNYTILINFSTNVRERARKFANGAHIDEDVDAVTVNVDQEPMSWIFLHRNADAGTIAHESWHAIFRILEFVNADLDNETVAYHLGYLVNEITNFRKGIK